MLKKDELKLIKTVPLTKESADDIRDKLSHLEQIKESISADSYNHLKKEYSRTLSELEEELQSLRLEAEQLKVEAVFSADRAAEAKSAALQSLSEIETLHRQGIIDEKEAKKRRKKTKKSLRLAETKEKRSRYEILLIEKYLAADSPDEVSKSKRGSEFALKIAAILPVVPKKVFIGAGLTFCAAAAAFLIILVAGSSKSIADRFLEYIPADAVKDSYAEIGILELEALKRTAIVSSFFDREYIRLIDEEVLRVLKEIFFIDNVSHRDLYSFMMLDSSWMRGYVRYVQGKYDKDRFIGILRQQGFKRLRIGTNGYYTDSYAAIVLEDDAFLYCDEASDMEYLLETKSGMMKSVLDSKGPERDFYTSYTDAPARVFMADTYSDFDFLVVGLWQEGAEFRFKLKLTYPEAEAAAEYFEQILTLMAAYREDEEYTGFSAEKLGERVIEIEVSGTEGASILEGFF
jgi:hypothetical protein